MTACDPGTTTQGFFSTLGSDFSPYHNNDKKILRLLTTSALDSPASKQVCRALFISQRLTEIRTLSSFGGIRHTHCKTHCIHKLAAHRRFQAFHSPDQNILFAAEGRKKRNGKELFPPDKGRENLWRTLIINSLGGHWRRNDAEDVYCERGQGWKKTVC